MVWWPVSVLSVLQNQPKQEISLSRRRCECSRKNQVAKQQFQVTNAVFGNFGKPWLVRLVVRVKTLCETVFFHVFYVFRRGESWKSKLQNHISPWSLQINQRAGAANLTEL